MMETQTAARPQLVSVGGQPFPLRSAEISATAEGGIAATTLRQSFENPYDEPLEVSYTLPLPADGAVIGYAIRMGETIIRGEIEKREDAERKYRKALEGGKLAGLLDQDRADTFHQNLGNLPARTPVEVEIRVLQPLIFQEPSGALPGKWEYRFPTVVGVRYMGEPGRVKDSERLDPDRIDPNDAKETSVALSLDLTILDGADVAPTSPTHVIRTDTIADARHGMRVTFDRAARLDRDVRIQWNATRNETDIRLIEGIGLAGDHGRYGLVTLTPPTAPDRIVSRDLTVLIDASGSMSGFPIATARDLATRLIRGLSSTDSFEITAFADTPHVIVQGPLPATSENVEMAAQLLSALDAGGCTEMRAAINRALKPLRPDAQRQIILMSDGYIGFEQEVISSILRKLPDGCRVYAVGIGQAPNRALTRGVGRAGRGCEILVSRADDLEVAAARLLAATAGPIVTDLSIEGSAVRAVAPSRVTDVFAGRPAVIAVELAQVGGTVQVQGCLAGGEIWSRSFDVASSRTAAETTLPLGALFGREAIEDQEMILASGKAEDALAAIETLGLRHRITSRRTSLVAVSENPTVDPHDPRRRMRLPVEMPADVEPEGVGVFAPASGAFDRRYLAAEAICQRLMPLAELAIPSEQDFLVESPRSRARTTRRRPLKPRPPDKRRRVIARVVDLQPELIVLEFEVPSEPFELTHADVMIQDPYGPVLGEIDPTLSTKPGRHKTGLTIRLAIRVDGHNWTLDVKRVEIEFDYGMIVISPEGSL